MRNALFASTAAAAIAFAGLTASSASAATFLYTYASTDGVHSGYGSFQANLTGPNQYLATVGTLTAYGLGGTAVTALHFNPNAASFTYSAAGYAYANNSFLPGQKVLLGGLSPLAFLGRGVSNFAGAAPGPGAYEIIGKLGSYKLGNFSLVLVSAVPEPASWALMLAGFGIVGAGLRARKPKLAVSYA